MLLNVKVIPNAKKNLLKQEPESWKVYLTAPAVDNKANQALIEILSDYFNVPKRQIAIIRGAKSRKKIIRI